VTSGLPRIRTFPRFWLLTIALCLPLGAASAAGGAMPILLVQSALADLRPGEVTGLDWKSTPRADLPAALCAARSDDTARLALASRRLTRRQREACASTVGGRLSESLIGRRAVFAMTAGAAFPLTSDILYRALAASVPGSKGGFAANHATSWRELDPGLPDAPIRILLPPADTIEYRIVSDIILYDGCATRALAALPADPVRRLALCTAMRSDAAVSRAPVKSSVAGWLHGQGGASVALIGVATLLAEPDLQTALPLDGVAPSFVTIADGRYRAALPVYLQARMSGATARTAAAIAGPLLAESAIGPLGSLARHGLGPLSAADRVKLRRDLGREFENAAE